MEKINIGKCISRAQAETGKRNTEMADHFNVHVNQIGRWKRSQDIKIHLAQDLAEFFDIPLIKFLGI